MNTPMRWWDWVDEPSVGEPVNGLVPVSTYRRQGRPPEEIALIEKAKEYGADAVFFEAAQGGRNPTAQAFVYGAGGQTDDRSFAELHRKLWSWGGVPLVYRRTRGLLQLFRCAHRPDFVKGGAIQCNPVKTLELVGSTPSLNRT